MATTDPASQPPPSSAVSSSPYFPFWGEPTSTLDWCEENYMHSRFIAEPANTFSNLLFFGLSVFGIHQCLRQGLPARFVLCHLGILVVGLGSFWFHASLLHEAQLSDELPMIYASAIFTYCVFETSKSYGNPRNPILLPSLLVAAVSFITAAYLYLDDPVFHQTAYAIIQTVSAVRVNYLLFSSSPSLASLNGTPMARHKRAQIRRVFSRGTIIFLSGFAVWNVDNVFCDNLRRLRTALGSYPLGLLTEGHAYWHLATGYGAFLLVIAAQFMVVLLKEGEHAVELQDGWFPRVKRSAHSKRSPGSQPKARASS